MTISIHSCLSPASRTEENKKRSTVSSICEQHPAETLRICPYEVVIHAYNAVRWSVHGSVVLLSFYIHRNIPGGADDCLVRQISSEQVPMIALRSQSRQILLSCLLYTAAAALERQAMF